jgi:membrane dipeptidase
MKVRIFLLVFTYLFTIQCLEAQTEKQKKLAYKLAHKYIITNGHVDLPYRLKVSNFRLEKEYLGIPYQTENGDFDYVRAKEGGLNAPFMSIYIPSSYQVTGGAKEFADSLINMVNFIADGQPQYFEVAKTPTEVQRIVKKGKIALPMGMENGAPVEDDLSLVKYFRDRGISYITLTHAKDNKICDSSYDSTRTWKGLSPYGYQVINEMQKVGIMIDISHVSDSTFYQVIRNVKVPVIASHSSARKFTPGFERNMSDDMIAKMKPNGGVIMVNFGTSFLDGEVVKHNDELRENLKAEMFTRGLKSSSEEGKKYIEEFKIKNPNLFADVKTVADHIDHIVKLCGVQCVGFGSDYDGVGDSLPTGLKDVAAYPNLIAELLYRGYSNGDIEKICSGNLFRVWNKVLKTSK